MRSLIVRELGLQDYAITWQAMVELTHLRDENKQDELWLLQHPPIFTQGQAGKAEHILDAKDIPVIQVDRGGQVTYHGPGQLVIYTLFDLRRLKIGAKALVTAIENSIIKVLTRFGVEGETKSGAPGVYVKGAKIASIGLRIRRGASFHGLALNVTNDLNPFKQINPCGYKGLEVTRLNHWCTGDNIFEQASRFMIEILSKELGFSDLEIFSTWD